MKGRGSCEGAAPPTAVAHNRLLSRAGCVGGHHHTSALAFLAGWHHRTGAPSVMTAKDVSADIARYIVNLAFNSSAFSGRLLESSLQSGTRGLEKGSKWQIATQARMC
eukprot:TRINITY_DN3983_c0_g1_i2.p2 TRINITY_DN3983_c0_g1~~TRINITY_DN3983_c0_g1_i2.p2  ORF type:complete len:116 (+),score=13.62 TRINITY_DN3983_c0_g1_i2:25-348(+)